jgi:MFS family permease
MARPVGEASQGGRWRALVALAVAFISDSAEGGLVNVLFPVIRQSLQLGVDALGLLSSISRVARMVFGPLWSVAADRYGRTRVLVLVTGVWGIWTAAAGLAQDFTQLLILYSIGVIGTVASEPIANALLTDLFAEHERGRAYGAIRSVGTGGGLVLVPLIGQLASIPDGWRLGMLLMGLLSMLSGLLIALFVREPLRRQAANEFAGVRMADVSGLFRIPSFALLAAVLPMVTSLLVFPFFVTFFVDARGWPTGDATLLFGVFMAGFALSSIIGGLLGDQFERRRGPNGRIMLMQLYLLGFAAVSYLALQYDWGRGAAVYGVQLLFGLVASIGFSGVVLPMVSAIVPTRLAATAFAVLFSLIQGLAAAVLTLALGALAQWYGFASAMLWLVTLPYLANALCWFAFYRVYPRDVAAQRTAREAAG